ncbi:MAG: hypothetical protein PHE06_02725 [Lachnospiraceae bacterium]|nr:hypothetical protein [Lachnospiraceae bacterium]
MLRILTYLSEKGKGMKYTPEHFSEVPEKAMTADVREITRQNEILYKRLTADLANIFQYDAKHRD